MENEELHTHSEGSFEFVVSPILIGVGIGVFATLLLRMGVGLYQDYRERQEALAAIQLAGSSYSTVFKTAYTPEPNLNGATVKAESDADKVL